MNIGFSCLAKDLFQTDSNDNVIGVSTYHLPTPIPIITWDMKRYGDTWKFIVTEIDAVTSQTFTQQINISSKFGTNYTNTQKEGPGFGSTTDNGVSYTQTYQAVINGGNDQLAEGTMQWLDPILLSKRKGPYNITLGEALGVSTGFIDIGVEPRKIQ